MIKKENELKIAIRTIRIKNNKLNFQMGKLEFLHRNFLKYATKFEKLYRKYRVIEFEKKKNQTNWLMKNMHYQNFLEEQQVEESFEICQSVENLVNTNFEEFMKPVFSIGKVK